MSDLVMYDVERLAEKVVKAQEALDKAIRTRDGAIHSALVQGYQPALVAEAAMVTRAHVNKIRKADQ